LEPPLAFIALGAIVAGFVQGLSGFGFALVSMSFWAWAVEPQLAAALAVFGGLTGQVINAFSVRRGFDLKVLAPFVLGGLVGIPLGTVLLPLLDARLFKVVLGFVLAVWCPVMLFADQLPRFAAGGRVADGAVGVVGGIMGGIGGFSGAVPTLWCTLRGMEKDRQRSVIQNFNLTTLAFTQAAYVLTGMVTKEMLPVFAIVAPAMLVPAWLGTRLYLGISAATFRKIVLTALTGAGIAMLASALPALFSAR
jgi:uncharacterized membrane protein YfcA